MLIKKVDGALSRKNHKIVDGRLIQTDKKFSALKSKQKIQTAEIWIPYYEVRNYFSSKLNKWNKKYITRNVE